MEKSGSNIKKKMRILIINPPSKQGVAFVREGRCEQRTSSFQYVLLPVSLLSIAAVLRKNEFKVKVIDAIAENLGWPNIEKEISLFLPKLIILNVSTVTFDDDLHLAKMIKKEWPSIHVSAIGVHVTSLPEGALSLDIDSVIRGEPEITSLKLAQAIKKRKNLGKILGLSYKEKKKIYRNPDRPYIKNLDNLPFPARDLVKNERYLMSMSTTPHTVLLSSRGCDKNCIFCTARQYYGQRLRLRSAENVIDEMEEIKEKYKINYITMWSDTFTLNKDFVMKLCHEMRIKRLKIKWMCNSRVDTIDEEMLRTMKKAGCIGIAFGVESGVQKILNNCGKQTKIKEIKKAFKLMKKVGIESLAHFILGLPGETKKTIKETIKFAKELDPDYAQFYCAIPFPGTPFYTLAKREGWIVSRKWEDYEINKAIIETPSLSRKELERARRWAYISFYFRLSYLLKRLSKIKTFKEFKYFTVSSYRFIKDWGIK